MQDTPLSGLRIGIFGKEGTGKSTMTVLLARELHTRGYSVLILDADSTNVGLAPALGIGREPDWLLDYFGGMVFSGGAVTCPVDEPSPLPDATLSIERLPTRYVATSPEGIRVLVAGKLGSLGPGAGCDGPIAKIARDLRVTDMGPNDVTLVDFKAGFEDSARGALTTLDWALAVVDPTGASLQMAVHLHQMVSQMHRGIAPATRHLERADLVELAIRQFRDARVRGVLAVLNRVPNAATEVYLRRAVEREGPPVVGVLGEDPSIQELWLHARRIESEPLATAAAELARRLEAVEREVGASAVR
jgi:CO dehydrogenase nickel-insertion accessory protein CooC1